MKATMSRVRRRERTGGAGASRPGGCRLTFHGLPADELLRRIHEEHERCRCAPAPAVAGAG